MTTLKEEELVLTEMPLEHRSKLIEDLCAFIRIPSRSSPRGGEEGALQAIMAQRMRQAGARVRAVEVDQIMAFCSHPLCHGPDRQYHDRPTVIGEIGPKTGPALLILAHSDTVPVMEPEQWTVDPFAGVVRQGEVCGLGAGDDKWGLAVIIRLLEALQSSRSLPKRLIFASTIDEEHGVGNGSLLLALTGVQAEAAIYLDGADMQIGLGCHGGSNLVLRPDGLDNASILRHAAALEAACKAHSRKRETLYDRPFFRHHWGRSESLKFRCSDNGGLPTFTIHFYSLPGEDRASITLEVEQLVRATLGADVERYSCNYREPWFEPALVKPTLPIVQCLGDSIRTVTGAEPVLAVNSKQDSFVLINHAGIPTLSFGVARSSGRGAYHCPDEAIGLEEAWQGCRTMYETILRWLRS